MTLLTSIARFFRTKVIGRPSQDDQDDMLEQQVLDQQNSMVQISIEEDGKRVTRVGELDSAQAYRMIMVRKTCPTCGKKRGEGTEQDYQFFAGPSGGMSQNIYCVNPACRQAYNVTPQLGIAELLKDHKGPDGLYTPEVKS
jgi:hypothetical protein